MTTADKLLTPKQLLRKASSKISAVAFLTAYQTHLRLNYQGSQEILDQYEAGKLLPTPTLLAIKQVVQAHIAENFLKKNAAAISKFESEKDKPKSGAAGSGKYACQFFIKKVDERTGEMKIELFSNAEGKNTFRVSLYQQAMGLIDRRQNEMNDSVYGRIVSVENGKEIVSIIPRGDSIARINKKKGSAFTKNTSSGMSKPLKSYPRARNDRFSFSRG